MICHRFAIATAWTIRCRSGWILVMDRAGEAGSRQAKGDCGVGLVRNIRTADPEFDGR